MANGEIFKDSSTGVVHDGPQKVGRSVEVQSISNITGGIRKESGDTSRTGVHYTRGSFNLRMGKLERRNRSSTRKDGGPETQSETRVGKQEYTNASIRNLHIRKFTRSSKECESIRIPKTGCNNAFFGGVHIPGRTYGRNDNIGTASGRTDESNPKTKRASVTKTTLYCLACHDASFPKVASKAVLTWMYSFCSICGQHTMVTAGETKLKPNHKNNESTEET